MKEIYDLYAGKLTPEAVLRVTEAPDPTPREQKSRRYVRHDPPTRPTSQRPPLPSCSKMLDSSSERVKAGFARSATARALSVLCAQKCLLAWE